MGGFDRARIITSLINYQNLKKFGGNIDKNKECSITLKSFDNLVSPVVLPSVDENHHLFEYDAIVRWHNSRHTNPNDPSQEFRLDQLQRIDCSEEWQKGSDAKTATKELE